MYFETVFAISFVLNFFVDFTPDGSTIPTRNMKQIAIRYLKSDFLLDFIPLIPFPTLLSMKSYKETHFYMIKIIRLAKCERIFNTTKIMH